MKILVVAEHRDGILKKAAGEAIRAGRTIADQTGGEVVALVIGRSAAAVAPSWNRDARRSSLPPKGEAKACDSAS